jgi:phospholipid transport system transporter-binding protein
MLTLPEELTHQQASRCLQQLLQALRAQDPSGNVVLDATPLVRFDSAALGVLLECKRQASAWGLRLCIQGLSARLAHLAQLYGVFELLAPPAAKQVVL